MIACYGRPISVAAQIYHCEMLLLAMEKLQRSKSGDTRIHLDMDDCEVAIVSHFLAQHLADMKARSA